MINAFLIPFISVFLAEIGDKTQLTIALLTHKTRKHLLLLLGVSCGFFLADLLAIIAGTFITHILPVNLVKDLAGLAFILFGIITLKSHRETSDEQVQMKNPFLSGLILIFLGEFGDKTQIAITLLATKYHPLLVFIGSLTALISLTILTIFLSKSLLGRINKKFLANLSGIVFIVVGIGFIIFQ